MTDTKLPIRFMSDDEYETEQRNPAVRYVIGRGAVGRKLGIGQNTLTRLVEEGVLPVPFTIPGSMKYLWFEVDIDAVVDSWAAAAAKGAAA